MHDGKNVLAFKEAVNVKIVFYIELFLQLSGRFNETFCKTLVDIEFFGTVGTILVIDVYVHVAAIETERKLLSEQIFVR